MNRFGKRPFLGLTFLLILWGASTRAAAQQILYAQINGPLDTTQSVLVDIPQLSLVLPPLTATHKFALIILNVPAPFATGNNFPGINFAIKVQTNVVAEGGFSYSEAAGPGFGRMPTTIVARVPLIAINQLVVAQWTTFRNSTGKIDSFASLSAIVGR